jgi:pimeloyl-ACP methyl ester carboxylesterase
VDALTLTHPDDASKKVEYFLEKAATAGPWPVVVFLHGHQEWPRPGAKDFVNWCVLDRFRRRGYLAVAISQPGYPVSTGPADFCGAYTQHAVSGVIVKLKRAGLVVPEKIVIEGITRGAIVSSLVAAHDTSIAGIVLISGPTI